MKKRMKNTALNVQIWNPHSPKHCIIVYKSRKRILRAQLHHMKKCMNSDKEYKHIIHVYKAQLVRITGIPNIAAAL